MQLILTNLKDYGLIDVLIAYSWGLQTTARWPDIPGIQPAIVYFDYIVKLTM
jgi:hypothetical protein